MIAVDTLVHNFLHRTGILHRLHGSHRYGPGCYRPSGCADIIEQVAGRIDAREFNPEFPATFPRFVQRAIWFYCAQSGLDVCNCATPIASTTASLARIYTVSYTVYVTVMHCINQINDSKYQRNNSIIAFDYRI